MHRPSRSSPIPALDGVRGIAVLLVLVHNLSPFDGSTSGYEHLATVFLNPGWIGVQLFFVLSGFLITGVLLDSRGAPSYYASFFCRRVLRIFPLYYATLFVAFVLLPLAHAQPAQLARDSSRQVFLWTYLDNWTSPLGCRTAAFSHFWSLAVEEQFYLAWPLVVHVCGARRMVRLALWMSAVALACRFAIRAFGGDPEMAYEFTVCRMDALALGGAVAAIARTDGLFLERHRARFAALCVGIVGFGFFATNGYRRVAIATQTLGYTALAIAFAALVAAAVGDHTAGGGRIGRVLANPVLRVFGKYSYAMYVFHVPLNDFVGIPILERFGPVPPRLAAGLAYIACSIAATFALAYVSYVGFEQHFLRLKRYFDPFKESTQLSRVS
jgi:peptidoglycan/LPS O-acetylase OafA/YrhL